MEHQKQLKELQLRVQTDFVAQRKEITEIQEKYATITKAYDALEKTTKEMRTGRNQRVEKDMDNRKQVVELSFEL